MWCWTRWIPCWNKGFAEQLRELLYPLLYHKEADQTVDPAAPAGGTRGDLASATAAAVQAIGNSNIQWTRVRPSSLKTGRKWGPSGGGNKGGGGGGGKGCQT
jgi:hypothetical protein